MMESPYGHVPESPLEVEEMAYPCKGCGEILEEGKAFELAGNRWHIDCFRCNTCGTLLDSDANLLLLGDGSLICNNCTYSCSSCGNKIEDLAILTGDQAFCANCFKCRNCKRKIENLRYARTSQGIFCMECHEALMARRRKKTARGASDRKKNYLEKSLPAIPPPEQRKTTYIPGTTTLWSDVYPVDTPELPASVPSVSRSVNEMRVDPDSEESRPNTSTVPAQSQSQGLMLPSTTYNRKNRQSYQSTHSDASGTNNEEFLIPVAFDPTPVRESPPVLSQETPKPLDEKSRDYFNRNGSQSAAPPSNITGQAQSQAHSPHIAYQQEKARQASLDRSASPAGQPDMGETKSELGTPAPPYLPERSRKRSDDPPTFTQKETTRGEQLTTSDPPRGATTRFAGTSSRTEGISELPGSPAPRPVPIAPVDAPLSKVPMASSATKDVTLTEDDDTEPSEHPLISSAAVTQGLPKRGDSLEAAKAASKRTIPRKEIKISSNASGTHGGDLSREASVNNTPNLPDGPLDSNKINGGKVISAPLPSQESQGILEAPLELQTRGDTTQAGSDSFSDPRVPPRPPPENVHGRSESLGTLTSGTRKLSVDVQRSPKLPRWSGGGDFTLDEDMARILGGEEPAGHESFLRRVSNSVRHGRSQSDKSGRLSRERWPKSPTTAPGLGLEISSPSSASPEHRDEISWYKSELHRERQKNVEREKKIMDLEAQLDSTANIKQANIELREKRSTMVILDSQKEMVVRELEVLTEHINKAKASKEPLDLAKLSSGVLRDFAEALERLKNNFAPQIEDFIEKRNDLLEEIAKLTTMKEKSFQEFEQLSSKNAQLAELNNQLVHQIQDIYKANSSLTPDSRVPAPNGLGIYAHHKDKSQVSIDSREARTFASEVSVADSGTTLHGENEPVIVSGGPSLVNIKKVQGKRFDWKRGKGVAKGMAKGVKGAFTSTQQSYNRDMQFAETGAYGQMPTGQDAAYAAPKSAQEPPTRQGGFGFFGNPKTQQKGNGLYATPHASGSTPSLTPDPSTHLFGSDLQDRADFEKIPIPAIVRRCVEEVESRGMDVEGIYRKSGASSQVNQVRDHFEQDDDFDISDPDLDIHAVTSALKQYFRKLPMPLITYDVYDRLLDVVKVPEGPQQKQQRIQAIHGALQQLPRIHYVTMEFLFRHLGKVVQYERQNLMTSLNIAVVFAPTIMRPESVARELSDTKAKNEVVNWIVEDVEKVFSK